MIPTKDSELVGFMSNFAGLINSDPAAYDVEVATATALDAASDAFIASYTALITARANGVRSATMTADKDQKKKDLIRLARAAYGQIQDSLSVSDTLKIGLGIVVKGQEPTPEPVPATAPGMEVISVVGRTVRLRFWDTSDPTRSGRPLATSGLTLFSAVAEEKPETAEGWTFQGSTGKTTASVIFPQSVPAGAKVWFTCFWFNNRKQSGPLATALSTNVQGGSVVVTA